MTFDFFQQLGARQAGWQGIRGQVQGKELDDVVMCAVANRWARTDVPRSAFAIGAADTFERGFCTDDSVFNSVWAGDDTEAESGLDETPQPVTASNSPAAKPWASGRRTCSGRDMGLTSGGN